MRYVAAIVALSALFSLDTQAQLSSAGRATSTQVLLRLTRPAPGAIGIVFAEIGTGMIVGREAAESVEYLTGPESLWVQAVQQIAEGLAAGKRVRFEVTRSTHTPESCPNLAVSLKTFSIELDRVVSDPLDVAGPRDEKKQVLYTDSATYLIQVAARDAAFVIQPNGAADTPLHRAVAELHSTVARCATSADATVEQHDF